MNEQCYTPLYFTCCPTPLLYNRPSSFQLHTVFYLHCPDLFPSAVIGCNITLLCLASSTPVFPHPYPPPPVHSSSLHWSGVCHSLTHSWASVACISSFSYIHCSACQINLTSLTYKKTRAALFMLTLIHSIERR